jgi:hypothetical protein
MGVAKSSSHEHPKTGVTMTGRDQTFESEAEYAASQEVGVDLTLADRMWNRSHLWRAVDLMRSVRAPAPRPFIGPVYCQDEWWIDRHGHPHRVENMSLHYVRNVINFLERRAEVIHRRMNRAIMFAVLKLFEDLERPSDLVTLDGRRLSWVEVFGDHMLDEAVDEIHSAYGNLDQAPLDWLRDTPLMRALYARINSA